MIFGEGIDDFQENKIQILESIRSGRLCDDCRSWFQINGTNLSPSQLNSITKLLESSAQWLEQVESPKPKIFIGSSHKGLEIAKIIQNNLRKDYCVETWNSDTVFGLGAATIEALERAVTTYDFGIFLFTPDQKITIESQPNQLYSANVLFELGLFIGKLGRFRAYAVQPYSPGFQLPSDLNGVTIAQYDSAIEDLNKALEPACNQIRRAINQALISCTFLP